MNPQQITQSRSSTNGFGRRKVDREMGPKIEYKMHSGKSMSSNFSNSGQANVSRGGGLGCPSRDRLIFVMTNLIGQPVEVHVKNGSVISGIFHASNAEKDFGIVLKMARVIKDGSLKGQKPVPETMKKPQTMIIPGGELAQVIAKDVSLNSDEFTNGHSNDRRQDLMIDSVISQSHHVELERELKPWSPDKDVPECLELENIFDGTWNRKWDQFETNEALFGVKSTFDEELYTTKLERGPQMRELEREAIRIAREIQEEDTKDLHLAEERGIYFPEDSDLDEEIRFSAVKRYVDDSRLEESGDSVLNTYNSGNFGAPLDSSIARSSSDVSSKRVIDEVQAQASSTCSSLDEEVCSQYMAERNIYTSDSGDHVSQLPYDPKAQNFQSMVDQSRLDEVQTKDHDREKTSLRKSIKRASSEEVQMLKSEDSLSDKISASPDRGNSCPQPGISKPSTTSGHPGVGSVSSGLVLSPSSSVGSLSSEKSTLNPNTKEFKLNPNAKCFTPSASLRPQMPASEGSFYYAGNIPAVPHMQNLPMGIGIGPSFGGPQPVVYNPQTTHLQTSQAYFHPNGTLYGQQMILGQPRPVVYLPTYPPEMPYKGRNF